MNESACVHASYVYPATVAEAVAALQAWEGRARILAGGTDLMLAASQGRLQFACLIDITRIPDLDGVHLDGPYVTVGAATTFAALQLDAYLRLYVPALVEAAAAVGAPPIQAVATWVGNIVQGMPAADGAVVAVALAAEAHVVDAAGARWQPVETLYRGAKLSALDPTRQMISHLRFPQPRRGWGCAWRRAGRRPSLVLPTLNCASTIELSDDGTKIAAARLVLGPVAARPFRATLAEAYLAGREPCTLAFAEAGRIAQGECRPRTSPLRASCAYREALVPVLVSEGLGQAAQRARRNLAAYWDEEGG